MRVESMDFNDVGIKTSFKRFFEASLPRLSVISRRDPFEIEIDNFGVVSASIQSDVGASLTQ